MGPIEFMQAVSRKIVDFHALLLDDGETVRVLSVVATHTARYPQIRVNLEGGAWYELRLVLFHEPDVEQAIMDAITRTQRLAEPDVDSLDRFGYESG